MADEQPRGHGGRRGGRVRGQPRRGGDSGVSEDERQPHRRDQRDLEIVAQGRRIRELDRLLSASRLDVNRDINHETDRFSNSDVGEDGGSDLSLRNGEEEINPWGANFHRRDRCFRSRQRSQDLGIKVDILVFEVDGSSRRWKDSNTLRKKVPKKVLRYFPIIPRLQRLYKSSHNAKEMTWHATGKCTEPDKMQHPVDGRAWKDFDTKYPDFVVEPRNVQLGVGKDIDVYLRPLIDDLNDLWAKPVVETIDVATDLKFNMRADVTTKFNRPDHNVDCPPPTFQFQVFKSLCKSIGLRSIIRIDHQELKKVIWYVLHNSPEIDMYSRDNDPGVSESSELFTLACGPSQNLISVNFYVVNGVRFVVHSRDERRTTQNNGICLPGLDGEMYYGQLEQILEFSYSSFKTVLFRVKWLATKDDDPDVIHVDNSSDLALSTLNDLEIAALHIDGQSTDVDAPTDYRVQFTRVTPPDIIDVVDEDDDIIDEEDPIPHDLADSDDEDLVNLDIDDGINVLLVQMSPDVARGHGDDGGGDDHPPPHQIPTGCGGCLGNRGLQKPNFVASESWKDAIPPGDPKPRVKTQFDMRPHMESGRWPQIYAAIQQHLQKIYNGKKAALKKRYWIPDSDGTYNLKRIRQTRPSYISEVDWDA
ncbi:hypothetical protein Tco_0153278 [Tanacetum coccineum]